MCIHGCHYVRHVDVFETETCYIPLPMISLVFFIFLQDSLFIMRGLFGIYFYGHELDQDGYRDVVDGELDTEHSPRLSELVMHCERAWFSDRAGFYPIESLASLGVTVIPLPDVESLLSGASHFRPCPIPIVESHLKVSRRDLGVERWESLSGDMAEQLWQVATFMLEDARRSRGNIKELTGWAEI